MVLALRPALTKVKFDSTMTSSDATPERDPLLAELPLRRVPTQTRSRAKVLRAVDAAEVLVRREGVEAITLPRVAAAAGVSVGALYQYLPDREAILAAIVARYHGRLERLLDDVLEQIEVAGPDPVGRVLRAVIDIYDDEELARSLGTVRSGAPDADEARRRHKQRMASKVAALLQRAGVIDEGDDERAYAVSRVAFASADAVLHEAFAAEPDERALLLAELERALRIWLGA